MAGLRVALDLSWANRKNPHTFRLPPQMVELGPQQRTHGDGARERAFTSERVRVTDPLRLLPNLPSRGRINLLDRWLAV